MTIKNINCTVCNVVFQTTANPSRFPKTCSDICKSIFMHGTLEERFCRNTIWVNECLIWTKGLDGCGYGVLAYLGETYRAHRLMWEMINGEIPEGLVVLHKCDNPPCVNPEHLELGTIKDNVTDMARKDRHGKITISTAEVNQIIERVKNGELQKHIAAEYNVQPTTISRYVNGARRNV